MKDVNKRNESIFPPEKLESAGPQVNFKTTKDGMADWHRWVTSKEGQMGESPSAMCHSSARAIAKLAAFMANNGSLAGEQLISEETHQKMHSDPKVETIYGFGSRSCFYKGGVNRFTKENFTHPMTVFGEAEHKVVPPTFGENLGVQGREGFIGWMGLGGSVMQWHLELKIGFGYVPSDFNYLDFNNTRAAKLQNIVMQCVKGETPDILEDEKSCNIF